MNFTIEQALRLPPVAATEPYPIGAPSAEVAAAASSQRIAEFTPDFRAFYGAEGGVQG